MGIEITVDLSKIDPKMKKMPGELQKVALEGGAQGVRVVLDKHFLMRQSEPRKDGFPMQGFGLEHPVVRCAKPYSRQSSKKTKQSSRSHTKHSRIKWIRILRRLSPVPAKNI